MRDIPQIAKDYMQYIDEIIKKLNPSILLYGSTAYGINSSDFDVGLIVVDYSKEDFDRLKKLTMQFQIENGMSLDQEVPYENKLIYREYEIESMLKTPPFGKINERYIINPIIMNEEYLKSDEMKARLLINILTVRSLLIQGDSEKVSRYREKAWDLIIKSAIDHNDMQEIDLRNFIELLHSDIKSGAEGEMFLGYKSTIPQKKRDLIIDCEENFKRLVVEGKMIKNENGILVPDKSFYMNDQDYKERIIRQLKTKYIDNIHSTDSPKFIFIGGTPSSGKTVLEQKVIEENLSEEFVVIDADSYRQFCPDLQELLKDPTQTAITTSKFANEIEMELLMYALNNKKNIVHSSSLRATDIIMKLIQQEILPRNYNVECACMAVPLSECLLSAQERYEEQIESKKEVPRFVGIEFMGNAHNGYLNTLRAFENSQNVSSVRVYKRGKKGELPKIVYNSASINKSFSNALEAVANTNYQEEKVMSPKNILERCEKLFKIRKQRNALPSEYEPLKSLVDKFSNGLNSEYCKE